MSMLASPEICIGGNEQEVLVDARIRAQPNRKRTILINLLQLPMI